MKLAEFGELLEGELGVFHDEVHVHFVTEHFQCSRFGCFRAAFFDAFFDASAFDAFAEITHVIDLLFKCRSHGDLKVILQDLFLLGGIAFLQEQDGEKIQDVAFFRWGRFAEANHRDVDEVIVQRFFCCVPCQVLFLKGIAVYAVLPVFGDVRADPYRAGFLDALVVAVLEFGSVLGGNQAGTVVYGPFDQGITRIVVILGFDVEDQWDWLMTAGRECGEPDVIVDGAFMQGVVLMAGAVDIGTGIIWADAGGSDVRHAFDVVFGDIRDAAVLEFYGAGAKDPGKDLLVCQDFLAGGIIGRMITGLADRVSQIGFLFHRRFPSFSIA